MKSVINVFKRVPKKALLLALVIAVAISMVAVAGTFAVFETTVIGLGETPISDWNFDVRINNDNPVDSVVSGVKLSGDNETTDIDLVTYNLHNTRDDSNHIKDYQIAPGTAGYMPIEVDGSSSKVAMIITVKAEFSYTNGFSFTDNLRRTLAITDENESYSYEDEESNAVNATYVGYITYSYYVSYEQMSHWADDDYIDIGFRWDWSEDDDTAYDDIPEYVYTRICVTGKQITNANQIKSADTAINFIWDNTKTIPQQLQYGNVLNIINVDGYNAGFELTDADITGDLYLDVNANGFTEASAPSKLYGTMLQGNVIITSSQDVKFVLGTNRTQHGYLSEYIDSGDYADNIPYVSITAPNADAYISNDFIANKVQTANNLVDILNASMDRMGESQADTMYEALTYVVNDSIASEELADYNANVNVTDVPTLETIISLQYGNCDVVWDSASNRFAFVTSDGNTVTKKADISTIDLSKKYKLFKTYSAMPATQTYSIYAVDSWTETTVTDLTVGFDAGSNSEITSITYNRASATTAQEVVIRTNTLLTQLVVNAPLDTINHYGTAGSVDIIAAANASYHEFGVVPFIEVAKGRIELETTADVDHIHISRKITAVANDGTKTKEPSTFDAITVDVTYIEELPTFSRDAVATIASDGTLVVTVTTESDNEKVYLFQQGIYEQIKVEKIEIGNTNSKVWVNTSDADEDVKIISEEIANNISGTKDVDYTIASDTRVITIVDEDNVEITESGLDDSQKEEQKEEVKHTACGTHTYDANDVCTKCGYDNKPNGTFEKPFVISNGQEWTDAPSKANGSTKTYYIVTADFALTGSQTLNVTSGKNMSIDMQDHQVSGNGDYSLVFNYGTLELKNGGLDTLLQDQFTCVRNFGTMTLNNVDIDSTWTGVFNRSDYASNPAQLSVTDCRIYGDNLAIYNGEWEDDDKEIGFGSVEIFSGEFKSCGYSTDDLGWDAIAGTNKADIVIHTGTFIYGPYYDNAIPIGMLANDSNVTNVYKQTNLLDSSKKDTVSVVSKVDTIECTMQFDGEEEIEYASLINAYAIYADSNKDATIKLMSDFVSSQFDLFCYPVMTLNGDEMGSLTIDLNGYTFEQTSNSIGNSRYTSETGVSLTIMDSSTDGDGCYYRSGTDGLMSLTNSTTIFSSGCIKRDCTQNAVSTIYIGSASTLYITGGTFVENKVNITNEDTRMKKLFKFGANTGKIVISGGVFDGTQFALTQEFADYIVTLTTPQYTASKQINATIVGDTIEITQSNK